MGKMNPKYGSELHLYRRIECGIRQQEFTQTIVDAINLQTAVHVDTIDWSQSKQPEKNGKRLEWRQLSFLGDSAISKSFSGVWKGGLINWDAIGYDPVNKVWVLCEAKANIEEMSCNREKKKRDKILNSFKAVFRDVEGVQVTDEWLKDYYQFANRLLVQKFLESEGLRSVLVNIYFCGDTKGRRSVTCPENSDDGIKQWREAINCEYLRLGLNPKPRIVRDHVANVFIPV